MFVPAPFREDRVEVLHETIRQSRLATLVTFGPDGLVATHAPMLLDPHPLPFGTLLGHISRNNAQWRRTASDVDALVICTGPDAYITPSWYPTKRETGKVVPTWNYVAVHAYGPVRFFDDAERLLEVVTRLTETHEASRDEQWRVADAPVDFVRAHLAAIVGFEIPISRLEGKWKMSQNRSSRDRAGVVDGLEREGGPAGAEVARIVAERGESL